MHWNWQLPDWTQFGFDYARLRDTETRFLKGAGVIVGSMHHLDGNARRGIVIELISQEMVDSSAIEGEILDRVSLQSSIARQLGFPTDTRRPNPAEAGAAELMADLYRHYAEPLTNQLLFDWHEMLMNGRRIWRTSDPIGLIVSPCRSCQVRCTHTAFISRHRRRIEYRRRSRDTLSGSTTAHRRAAPPCRRLHGLQSPISGSRRSTLSR